LPQRRSARAGIVTNQVQALHYAKSGVWLRDLRLLPGLTPQVLLTNKVVRDPVSQGLFNAPILLGGVADDDLPGRVADGVLLGGFADYGLLRGFADDGAVVLRDGFVERLKIFDVLDGDGIEIAALALAEPAKKGIADNLQQHRL